MNIIVISRTVLVAGAAMAFTVAFTVGVAAAKTDIEAARRHCMALARLGTLPGPRPSLLIQRHQTVTFNQCMEREGFPPGPASAR